MKLFTVALGIGLLGAGSASAATPYYVGEHMTPENNLSLGFQDTPTKNTATSTSTDTGNIMALEVKGDYVPRENLSLGLSLPFYSVSKKVTGTSRNSIGNVGLNGNWNMLLSNSSDDFAWGYSVALDFYLPTSRKDEAGTVAAANITTDFYGYTTKATTAAPRVGLFIEGEKFFGKTNLGYAYTNIRSVSDKNRNSATWQTAATWKAMPKLNLNLEYNSIILDATTAGAGNTKYRHAITPSVSGNWDQVIASAHVNLPLDSQTRDIHNVSFGLNTGWAF